MERHILRERTSSSHIFFREPGGANACTPLQAHQRRPNQLCVPCSTTILCTLSKSDCMVLIMWSPSSYTPVQPDCPDVLSSSSLLITAWQLVKAHGVTRNKPKIHVICYITLINTSNNFDYKQSWFLNLQTGNNCLISFAPQLMLQRLLLILPYLPTPPLRQDMTQGQFLSGV